MKVFISWSGERSRAVAESLHEWLPNVIQAVRPFMSANDIEKGTRWRTDLADELEQASVSIICLTPENLEAPWILFEAGALSKLQKTTYVCTFLFGIEPVNIREPLAQFQATKAHKDDVEKLIQTINRACGEFGLSDVKLRESFEVWWPRLEKQLEAIPETTNQQMHQRNASEVLEEILELVRNLSRGDRAFNLKSKSRPRLITTLGWTVEDGRLLTDHYDDALREDSDDIEALSRHLTLLATDKQYALITLKLLKRTKKPLNIPEFITDVLSEWDDDIPF